MIELTFFVLKHRAATLRARLSDDEMGISEPGRSTLWPKNRTTKFLITSVSVSTLLTVNAG